MSSKNKDIDTLIRKIRKTKNGWDVTLTRGKHYTVRRNGVPVATLSGSGGEGKGYANARAELKRAGFPLEG